MSAERDGDGATEPLIGRDSGGESVEDESDHERPGQHHDEEEDLVTFGWFIWILTFSAGVSGLLFGYEYVLRIMIYSCMLFRMLRSISM
jgi:SP family myo-inositol transporter-like MFS transporter 13